MHENSSETRLCVWGGAAAPPRPAYRAGRPPRTAPKNQFKVVGSFLRRANGNHMIVQTHTFNTCKKTKAKRACVFGAGRPPRPALGGRPPRYHPTRAAKAGVHKPDTRVRKRERVESRIFRTFGKEGHGIINWIERYNKVDCSLTVFVGDLGFAGFIIQIKVDNTPRWILRTMDDVDQLKMGDLYAVGIVDPHCLLIHRHLASEEPL